MHKDSLAFFILLPTFIISFQIEENGLWESLEYIPINVIAAGMEINIHWNR